MLIFNINCIYRIVNVIFYEFYAFLLNLIIAIINDCCITESLTCNMHTMHIMHPVHFCIIGLLAGFMCLWTMKLVGCVTGLQCFHTELEFKSVAHNVYFPTGLLAFK